MANNLDNKSNGPASGGSKGVNVTSMINEFAKQNRDTKIENAKKQLNDATEKIEELKSKKMGKFGGLM